MLVRRDSEISRVPLGSKANLLEHGKRQAGWHTKLSLFTQLLTYKLAGPRGSL